MSGSMYVHECLLINPRKENYYELKLPMYKYINKRVSLSSGIRSKN